MGNIDGALLRDLRLNAQLTQPQLAALADISVRALRDIEQGRVTRPRQESLHRIADALKLSDEARDALLANAVATPAKPAVSIGILGPFALAVRGSAMPLTSVSKQRLISLLALEADRFVSVWEIADVLWDGQPPDGWRHRIHVHVSELRRLLEPNRRRTEAAPVLLVSPSGYRIGLPEDAIDACRFSSLLAAAQTAVRQGNTGIALDLYTQALSCWRGQLLAGTDGRVSSRPAASALRRERLAATCALADLAEAAGQRDRAVGWLELIAEEEPLDEAVHCRLMTALAGTGRQDYALRLYRELRARLADELGVDPAITTQNTYRGILNPQGASAQIPGPDVPRPAQLPMTTSFFTGREEATQKLVGYFTSADRAEEIPSPRILLVHGMPGVGKTALALHVAHAIRRCYPDGQLYADLRGEGDHPIPAGQLLSRFLRALGVLAKRIPPDINERAKMLRSVLTGRRVLIVLDDARSSEQVLQLLPSDLGNDVLITSRNPLAELPVTRHRLEPLTLNGSLSVISRLVPEQGVSIDSSELAMIADSCGGLPLALRVAAARLTAGASPRDLAKALGDARARLGELSGSLISVSSSLESGERELSALAQAALHRVAVLPTQGFSAWTVQVAMDVPANVGAQLLDELVRAHLVSRHPRHFGLHDLVKLHATGKATDEDRATVNDVLVHWFHLAVAAGRPLNKYALRADALAIPPARHPTGPAAVDARVWFDAEHQHLIDGLRFSAGLGRTRLAAGLLRALTPYFSAGQLTDEWEQCVGLTLNAAKEADDVLAWAYTLESLVQLRCWTAHLNQALPIAEQALALFEQAQEPSGQAQVLHHLQFIKRRVGRHEDALRIAHDELRLYEGLGQPGGQASAHQALGVLYREYFKDLGQAEHHFVRALALASADPTSGHYAQICNGLATVYVYQQRPRDAEPLLRQGVEIMRGFDDPMGVAAMLSTLGDVLAAQNRYGDASVALEESLSLAARSGQRDVQAHSHIAVARLAKQQGLKADCLQHLHRAADIYRTLDAPQPLAEILEEIATVSATD